MKENVKTVMQKGEVLGNEMRMISKPEREGETGIHGKKRWYKVKRNRKKNVMKGAREARGRKNASTNSARRRATREPTTYL